MSRYSAWKQRMKDNPYAEHAQCIKCRNYIGAIRTKIFCYGKNGARCIGKIGEFDAYKHCVCSEFYPQEDEVSE